MLPPEVRGCREECGVPGGGAFGVAKNLLRGRDPGLLG